MQLDEASQVIDLTTLFPTLMSILNKNLGNNKNNLLQERGLPSTSTCFYDLLLQIHCIKGHLLSHISQSSSKYKHDLPMTGLARARNSLRLELVSGWSKNYINRLDLGKILDWET